MNQDIRYANNEDKREPILRIWREINAREASESSDNSSEESSSEESEETLLN